jgi:hypothetical protein
LSPLCHAVKSTIVTLTSCDDMPSFKCTTVWHSFVARTSRRPFHAQVWQGTESILRSTAPGQGTAQWGCALPVLSKIPCVTRAFSTLLSRAKSRSKATCGRTPTETLLPTHDADLLCDGRRPTAGDFWKNSTNLLATLLRRIHLGLCFAAQGRCSIFKHCFFLKTFHQRTHHRPTHVLSLFDRINEQRGVTHSDRRAAASVLLPAPARHNISSLLA